MEDAAGAFGLVWPGNVANQTAWLFRPVAVHTIVYTGLVRSDVAPAPSSAAPLSSPPPLWM